MPHENSVGDALAAEIAPNLALLRAVRATGNLTKAADLLAMPQPTVSRRLTSLGERLGAALIAPDGRGIRLSRIGIMLADAADDALTVLETRTRQVHEEISPGNGHVVLGFLHLLGRSLVPRLLASFRQAYPRVRFTLVQGSWQEILDRQAAGSIDLALIAPVPRETPSLEAITLAEQELCLSVPAAHPLATRDQVAIAEQADEEFVMLEPGYGLRRIIDDLCAAAGFAPRIAFEGQESDTVRGLVAAGLGVALLPRFGGVAPSGVAELPLAPPITRTIGLIWPAGDQGTPAVRCFREHVRDSGPWPVDTQRPETGD